jgi:hypothetical protein
MSEHESEAEQASRRERLARALQEILKEGDAFQVVAGESGIDVTETRSFQFQERHPRLYGRLLSVNEQMEGGCMGYVLTFLAAGVLCFGINVGWFDEALGAAAEKLNSWWFFAIVLLVAFVLGNTIYEWQERRVYRRGRDELLALLEDEGLDRDTLLVQINDDGDLENVIKQLKLDPGPFRKFG